MSSAVLLPAQNCPGAFLLLYLPDEHQVLARQLKEAEDLDQLGPDPAYVKARAQHHHCLHDHVDSDMATAQAMLTQPSRLVGAWAKAGQNSLCGAWCSVA